jgi:hypothetical protein
MKTINRRTLHGILCDSGELIYLMDAFVRDIELIRGLPEVQYP